MTIRHLKIFITVADCGKMRQAAQLLYVSQPSISQAIGEIESYYGIKVFERLSQKLYLTEQGETLLSYARHIVDSYEKMDLAMKHAGKVPVLRVGGSVSVGTCMLQTVVDQLEKEVDDLEVYVVINNTELIEAQILKSELDIAIVEGVIKSKDIVAKRIGMDELVIIVGKSHPFYSRESISLYELEGMKVISREDGSSTRNQYENLLHEKGIKLRTIWQSSNTEPIKRAVIDGKGLTFISKMLIEREVKEGLIRIVPVKDVTVCRELNVIYHKDKYMTKTMEAFYETALGLGVPKIDF